MIYLLVIIIVLFVIDIILGARLAYNDLKRQQMRINTAVVNKEYDVKQLAEDLGCHVENQISMTEGRRKGMKYIDGPNGWIPVNPKPKKKGKK